MHRLISKIIPAIIIVALCSCSNPTPTSTPQPTATPTIQPTLAPTPTFAITVNKPNLSTGSTSQLAVPGWSDPIEWSSNNPYAVSVDQKGLMTGGHKMGKAVITARSKDRVATIEVVNNIVEREISASDLVAEIKIGTNFAGVFDDVDWTWKKGYDPYPVNQNGKDKVQYYMEAGESNLEVSPEMIHALKDAGFDAIRLPVTFTLFTNDTTFEIDPSFLSAIEEYVNIILNDGMYCIIEPHYDYLSKSWVGTEWSDVWMADEYSDYVNQRYAAIWQQVADQFADYDDHLIFEAMNEPGMNEQSYVSYAGYASYDEYNQKKGNIEFQELQNKRVNELNSLFVQTVRSAGKNNHNRFLMVGPAQEMTFNLEKFTTPNDDRLITTVHYYFQTQEGMGYSSWKRNNPSDTQNVDDAFAWISGYIKRTGSSVILGEFGNTENLPMEDRIDQATYVLEQAKKLGIPGFWWEYGYHDFESKIESFSLYDRVNLTWKWPEIMEAEMKIAKGQ